MSASADDGRDDEFWKFDVEDVGSVGPDPLEPGSPKLENVLFVLLGVLLALLFLYAALGNA